MSPAPPSPDPPRKGTAWQAWIVIALLAAAAVWALASRNAHNAVGPDLVQWSHDLDAAKLQAAQDHRPVYLLFTADWCPPCQQMKKYVYTDAAVAAVLNERFIPVKVDMTDESNAAANAVANQFNVTGIPTLIVLEPDGSVRNRTSGSRDAQELLQWLGS